MVEIGIINSLDNGGSCFERVASLGLHVCQLASWDVTQATTTTAETVIEDSRGHGVRISAVWGGVPGPAQWDFIGGPVTLGLVPEAYRVERIAALKRWADFTARIGAPALITHCGFIPENMSDPAYDGVLAAIREVAEYCAGRDLGFWFETGQETPVVLLRTIRRIDLPNLGVNLDPANLILYGKGNPIDALDVLGSYVRNIHIKDGLYPTDGEHLGQEVFPGQGRVCFPALLRRLREIGFTGELIIENEISDGARIGDIEKVIADLEGWIAAE